MEPEPNFDFNPEDYPDRVCCGILEHLTTVGLEFPFTFVTFGDREQIKGWAVSMCPVDPRTLGPVIAKASMVLLSNCPFCGKKLQKEDLKIDY